MENQGIKSFNLFGVTKLLRLAVENEVLFKEALGEPRKHRSVEGCESHIGVLRYGHILTFGSIKVIKELK